MSEHHLVNEIDPLKVFEKDQSKQVRGFTLDGVKQFRYLGNNQVSITELPRGDEYLMEYTSVSKFVEASGFGEKITKHSFNKLLSYYEVIYSFQTKEVFIKDYEGIENPTSAYMKRAIEEYDPDLGRVFGDNEEDFDNWYLLTNQV